MGEEYASCCQSVMVTEQDVLRGVKKGEFTVLIKARQDIYVRCTKPDLEQASRWLQRKKYLLSCQKDQGSIPICIVFDLDVWEHNFVDGGKPVRDHELVSTLVTVSTVWSRCLRGLVEVIS